MSKGTEVKADFGTGVKEEEKKIIHEEKNVKCYLTHTDRIIIGDLKEDYLMDALEIIVQEANNQRMVACMPIGHAQHINSTPRNLEVSKAGLLIEIKEKSMMEIFVKIYHDTMFKFENPGVPNLVVPPNSGKIIH